ncbi:MAG: lipopolysaccharide biosynthesis protein [Pedobacter sp.]|nr:MAG: lipopolysaccharide biosynthesis protein [Pedobacter sp.]
MNILKKILSIYKNAHFQSLFGNGLMAVIGMLLTAVLYRSLTIIEISIYLFIFNVNGFMDSLRGGFLTITFIKFYAGEKKERAEKVAGACWALGIATAALAVIINIPTFFIANYFSDPSVVLTLKYFCIIPLVTLPSFMANCVVQAYKRFDQLLIIRLLSQGSFLLVVVILIITKNVTLNNILIVYVGSNLLASVCSLSFKWTKILSLKFADWETVKEMFHFGKYAMGTNISSSLFGFTNILILKFLIGEGAIAIYNLASKLLQIIEIPLLSFAASGMPILASHYNSGEKKEMIHALQKLIGMLTIVFIPVALVAIIFAEPIIQLVGGAGYVHNEAPNLFRIFLVLSLFGPADRYFALALDVIHQPKLNFYKIWIMLIVNVIAVFIGINIYHSIYTIGFALLFPNLVAVIMTYYPLNKFYNFKFWDIYIVGYQEVMLFLKQFKKSVFSRA